MVGSYKTVCLKTLENVKKYFHVYEHYSGTVQETAFKFLTVTIGYIPLQKWVRFYRDESLRVAIYTNNGIERQNNWLKQSYLDGRRNNTITDLIEIIVKQFLPDSYKK